MSVPRLVIAGTHSGVGKTTIATGLMAALAEHHQVQGYKVGPDYIDPSYHRLATGRPSRNLDAWLLGDNLPKLFWQSAMGYWAVIEGVMGLFDGMRGTHGFSSTADIAKRLQAPVLLIVDAASMAQSAAALVYGFQNYDPEIQLGGVVFNRVRSNVQENMLSRAVESLGLPVLGCLPRENRFKLPERHLGLIPVDEQALREDYLGELSEFVKKYLNISQIEDLMLKNSRIPDSANLLYLTKLRKSRIVSISQDNNLTSEKKTDQVYRLGFALDEAFLFYYQDALDRLEETGFELVPFSPLHDSALPSALDAVFIGGGFPELFLPQLSKNKDFLASLRAFAQAQKPIYAECGGFMYLGESIRDFRGTSYPLAGIIPMISEMTGSLQGMGYREGLLTQDVFLGSRGSVVRGHEFHYSRVEFQRRHQPLFHIHRDGKYAYSDGYAEDNICASYLHLNFAGHPEILNHWLKWGR